jgi:hypothetical protein
MSTTQYGHYTSPAGLLGIVSREILWATNIKFLNDSHEFQHALDLIKEILPNNKVTPGKKPHPLFEEFINKVSHQLDTLDLYRSESVFTFAFSEEIDLLSQWRGYCPGNNGYCVVFDLNELHKRVSAKFEDCYLVQCVYDDAEKRTRLKKLLNSNWSKYHKLTEKKAKTAAIDEIAKEIVLLASYFKHPSFKEEREHRIVVASDSDIQFREARASLIPYIELPAPRELIRKIVVGPNADQALAKRALEAFLEKGCNLDVFFGSPEIDISKTPYRPR